jgi:hypothetical protein
MLNATNIGGNGQSHVPGLLCIALSRLVHVLHVQHAGDIVAAVPARGASSLQHHHLYQRSRPPQPAGAPLGRQQTPGAVYSRVCRRAKGGTLRRQRGGHEVHAGRAARRRVQLQAGQRASPKGRVAVRAFGVGLQG